MLDDALNIVLFVAAVLLMLIVVDFAGWTRYLLPAYALVRDNVAAVIIGLLVIVGIGAAVYEPKVHWR